MRFSSEFDYFPKKLVKKVVFRETDKQVVSLAFSRADLGAHLFATDDSSDHVLRIWAISEDEASPPEKARTIVIFYSLVYLAPRRKNHQGPNLGSDATSRQSEASGRLWPQPRDFRLLRKRKNRQKIWRLWQRREAEVRHFRSLYCTFFELNFW